MQRNLITIATGKPVYLDMAANLARSFIWWHSNSAIRFFLVTDLARLIPHDIKDHINVIDVEAGSLGDGFSSKLKLDLLAPVGQTLFIDSDCLLFGKLDRVFESFMGHAVSVVGSHISDGEWFGNIAQICKKFNINHLPKFNGGIYYLEKGAVSSKVYETARELETQYDEIGFVRLRNQPNDEVIMALAMELNNQKPVPDDGTIMSDPLACQGSYSIDVITGTRVLTNPSFPSRLHQEWYPHQRVKPLIVHFLGQYTHHYPYLREAQRLKLALADKLNLLTNFSIQLRIEYPARIKIALKNLFRPLFRIIFGTRKVKPSARI